MITLKLDNSISQITGLTVGQFKELKDLMSYDIGSDAAYFSGSTYNTKRSLLSKRGEFPTGLEYIVRGWIKSNPNLFVAISDTRVKPRRAGTFGLSLPFTPYEEQTRAAIAAYYARRGIICAPTGSGKSVIIALLISYLRVPTLVVVPTLELKRQTMSFLKGAFKNSSNITVENVDALDPKKAANFDCVIIDEFHHSAASTYRELNKKAWKNVYYRFGFTATPFRSNDNEKLLLESVLSQVVYEISYDTAVKNKFVVPLEAYYCELNKTPIKGDDRSWSNVYKELVTQGVHRNLAICEMLRVLSEANQSVLCLVKEIRHGEILAEMTGVPFANGKDGNSASLIRQFNSGGLKALIGTTGVVGEGVDTKPAEWVILASTGKSKTQFMQNCGRAMRRHGDKESAKVILFKDNSHKWLTKHFNACMLYLRDEYGIKGVKL